MDRKAVETKKSKNDFSRLLADQTRLEIYKTVIGSGGRAMTTAEVSERFGLHVNVARMHLEKLSGAGLLASRYRQPHTGGRPPREYSLGGSVFSFQHPPRDYRLLAEISLAALESGRKPATVAREYGRRLGEKALESGGLKVDNWGLQAGGARDGRLISSMKNVIEEQGLLATITTPNPGVLEVRAFNCIFKELSDRHQELVCGIHRQLFVGLCESHFGKVRVTSNFEIAEGGPNCRFVVIQIS